MKLASKLLAISATLVAVSVAIAGSSVAQAAGFTSSGLNGPEATTVAKPSPDDPIEERVEQAIEEVNEEGQNALAELGELDTSEKFDEAEQILKHMDQAAHEIRSRVHDRASDRFDELNDVAIERLENEVRSELRTVAGAQGDQRAAELRARLSERKAKLEARWSDRVQRVAQRQSNRDLPKFNFRRLKDNLPEHALALGVRLRLDNIADGEVDTAIVRLEEEAQAALERLGALDTPGKVERARKVRARLAERIHNFRGKVAERAKERAEGRGDDVHIANAALNQLGELDTPEKREKARRIRSELGDAAAMLKSQAGDKHRSDFEQRFEREAQALRHRARAALDQLGELDTPEKQRKAHFIEQKLAEQVRSLRGQLARYSEGAFDQQFEGQSNDLRQKAERALHELGRLDTREKVQKAMHIRARMNEDINRLKSEQARRLRDNGEQRFDTLTDRVSDQAENRVRDHMMDGLREGRGDVEALRDRVNNARREHEITPGRVRDGVIDPRRDNAVIPDRVREGVRDAQKDQEVIPNRVKEQFREHARQDAGNAPASSEPAATPERAPEASGTDGERTAAN